MILLVAAALAYDPIESAVAVSVSAGGLDRLGGAVADVMPESFPIGSLGGELVCDETDPAATLTFAVDALDVLIHIDEITITPTEGRLDVALYGAIDSTPTLLTATGSCPPLTSLAETCDVELGTTPLEAHFGLSLALVDGTVDATVDELSVTLGAISNPVDGCTVASAIGTLLGQNPLALTDLLQAQIDPALADLGPTIESSVEDALGALTLDTTFAVGEAEVGLALNPTKIDIDEDGLVLVLGATVSQSGTSTCVPPAEAPSSLTNLPVLDGTGPAGLDYDIGALVSKTFADQVLFAVYSAGGLCIDASGLSGLSLDTSLLGSAFGPDWEALFPVSQPVGLLLAPVAPPTIRFEEDGAPVRLDLNGLALHTWSALNGREARIASLALDGEVGVDLPFADGTLSPALDLDPDKLGFREMDHELIGPGYAEGMAEFLPTILDAALPADLLPTITLPSWNGLGVEGIWFVPAAGGDWLGVWVTLDTAHITPIQLAGCEGGTIGCDGSSMPEVDIGTALGCDSADGGCGGDTLGCSSSDSSCGGCTTVPSRPMFLVLGLAAAIWRRRRA